jgi:tetratricopeptide (TPR) repeat protein
VSQGLAGLPQWGDAAADAEEVVKLAPGFAKGYSHLAKCQLQLQRFTDAKQTCEKGLAELPADAMLTQLLEAVRKATPAESGAGGAQGGPEALKAQGNALYKRGQYAAAARLYSQAIELAPEAAAYYGNRSACYMVLGEFAKAADGPAPPGAASRPWRFSAVERFRVARLHGRGGR